MNCGVEVLKEVNSCCAIELRLLARLGDQRLRRVVERDAAAPGQILDLELEAAGRAEAGDRGRIEAQREGVGDLQQLRAHGGDDARGVLLGPRSSHGFRIANSTAAFDWLALVRKLKPLIEPTISTPGVRSKVSRTCLATASVRSSEAPSGSWITTKK